MQDGNPRHLQRPLDSTESPSFDVDSFHANPLLNTTLCYIECDGKYLMLHRTKKKDDISQGKWIGVGGKFESGETADECLLREVQEETGLALRSYDYRGVVHFLNDVYVSEEMYLYTAEIVDEGFPVPECDEGTFAWIPLSEVMELNLWPGDRIFLEMLMRGDRDIDLTLCYHGDDLVGVRY